MTPAQLVHLLRALLGAAEELAAEAAVRAAERDPGRAARTAADLEIVVEVVGAHPGIALGELRAAAVAAGLSAERATIALDAAAHAGRIVAAAGPGSSRRYFPPGGAP